MADGGSATRHPPDKTVTTHRGAGAPRMLLSLCAFFAALTTVTAQDQPTFRTGTQIVSVDVIVRDGSGNIVRGLTEKDFTITEDGRPQSIQTFAFEELANDLAPLAPTGPILQDLEARVREGLDAPARAAAEPVRLDADQFAGRRLIVLLFDVSSMQPEDVQRAVDAAVTYVDTQMSGADLVSIVTIGTSIDVLTDFSGSREDVRAALATLGYTEGTDTPPPS